MTAGQSPAHSGPDRLSDVERNRILDQAINSRDRPVFSGNINGFFAIHEPQITLDRSAVSAQMVWGKTVTSPIIVVLSTVLSFVTCGLFLPFWLIWTLRPNKFNQTVSIDENGLQHWGIAPIPQAQRLLSGAVAIGIVLWIIWLINTWHSVQTQ
jgi:hypothetical protein